MLFQRPPRSHFPPCVLQSPKCCPPPFSHCFSLALLPHTRVSSTLTSSAIHLFSALPTWERALRSCETGPNPPWSGDSGASSSGWPLSPSSTLAGHSGATHSRVSRYSMLLSKGNPRPAPWQPFLQLTWSYLLPVAGKED